MFLRLPLLLLCLLSLALGPVQLSAACMLPVATAESSCSTCCSEKDRACCHASDTAAPVKTPVINSTQVDDGKLLASPALVVVGVLPAPVAERPSYYQKKAARIPAPPRLDLTCIRLI